MGDERHEEIQRRAYQIWESEGGVYGDQDRHWHAAKEEIERESLPTAEGDGLPDGAEITSALSSAEALAAGILPTELLNAPERLTGDRASKER
jgi:hypothetical protein